MRIPLKFFDYVLPMSTGYFPAGVKQIEQDDETVLKKVAHHPFKKFVMGRG